VLTKDSSWEDLESFTGECMKDRRMLFAGEHTDGEYQGCMQGAY